MGFVLDRLKARFPRIGGIAEVLVGPGTFVPAEYRTNEAGEKVVVRDEVVEGKGVLRSKTVLLLAAGMVIGGDHLLDLLHATPIDWEAVKVTAAALITDGGAIWARIKAWMPTRG